MTDPAPQPLTQRHPSTTALAILLSITLLAVAILGWLWFTRYAPLHFDVGPATTIADARDATWILPIVFTSIFLVALAWILLWLRMRWEITALPLFIGIIGVLALVFAGREYWASANTRQPILVAIHACEAGSTGIQAGSDQLPEGCDPAPPTSLITIGTSEDPAMFTVDALGRASDLPRGAYTATLTTTLPPETSRATLAVETTAGILRVDSLERVEGDTWSGRISLHPDLESYHVLAYASPYTVAPDAEITFTVRECVGMSLADFDAAACKPIRIDEPVMEELPPDSNETGRPPIASVEEGIMTLSNLEARTYTLVPSAALVTMTSDIPAIFVIPASEPQTRENSILQPGESPFGDVTVEIDGGSGETRYVIYVFDDGQTVARATPRYATIDA